LTQIDSVLGALFQATPYAVKENKVVELPGGKQAAVSTEISYIGGWNLLDNNQVCLHPKKTNEGEFRNDFLNELFVNGTLCMALSEMTTIF